MNSVRLDPSPVKSGVPQGSVLGPLIFLVLIGDIDRNVSHAFLSRFADDTRIGSQIASPTDAENLQTDLEAVYQWAEDNNKELNADKFEYMHYGACYNQEAPSQYKSSSGSIIQVKEHVKDLGVTMSCDGTFHKHIQNAVAAAKDQCAWIMWTFTTRAPYPMLILWKSLVQCKLDYCSQLWSPIAKGDTQALEGVQRSFLRQLSDLRNMTYWEQLHHLKFHSVERRRERYLIIYIWRILEEQVPNIKYADGERNTVTAQSHPRRGKGCIIPKVSRKAPCRLQKLRDASLAVRGQRLFNALPAEVRNTTGCSVDQFKQLLNRFLCTVPDEPQIPGYTSQGRADTNSPLDVARFACAHPDSLVEVPRGQSPLSRGGCATSIALAQWCLQIQQGNKVTR